MASLKDSLTKGLTTLNVKTSNFMEESKVKTYISNLEKEIKELKASIGNDAYEAWANGQEWTEGLEERFKLIKEKYDEIDVQNEKVVQLKQEEQKVLGTVNSNNNNANNSSAPQGDVVYCSKCGTANMNSSKFCKNCGNQLITS